MPAVDIGTNPYTALIDKIPGVGKFINDYLLGRTPQDQMTNTLAPTYIKAIPVLSKGLLKIGVDSAKPEVLNLLKNSGYGELRGLISTKGQTAFWDAGKALHQPIADELNLSDVDHLMINPRHIETGWLDTLLQNAQKLRDANP